MSTERILIVEDEIELAVPFAATLWGTLFTVPISILVSVLSAWIPSGRALTLNPRNLIID